MTLFPRVRIGVSHHPIRSQPAVPVILVKSIRARTASSARPCIRHCDSPIHAGWRGASWDPVAYGHGMQVGREDYAFRIEDDRPSES